MHWCECNRRVENLSIQKAGPLRCSQCEGILSCDFCGRQTSEDAPFRSIAVYQIADHYTCQVHGWVAAASVQSLDADSR
jgi:hypothetical protein